MIGTRDRVVDEFLEGGVPRKLITEVFGQSGSGKSQFAIQLSINTIVYLKQAVVYLSTEGRFPYKRFESMYKAMALEKDNDFPEFESILDDIYISTSDDFDTQLHTVRYRIPSLIYQNSLNNKKELGLIVIDSVAALFRSDTPGLSSTYFKDRSKEFYLFGSSLKNLSYMHNLAVVCVNQVTDYFPDNSNRNFYTTSKLISSTNNIIIPSLGPTWSNIINIRIGFSKSYQQLDNFTGINRSMKICFSPFHPPSTLQFEIKESGCAGIGLNS